MKLRLSFTFICELLNKPEEEDRSHDQLESVIALDTTPVPDSDSNYIGFRVK